VASLSIRLGGLQLVCIACLWGTRIWRQARDRESRRGRLSWRPPLAVPYHHTLCRVQDRFCDPAPSAPLLEIRCPCTPDIVARSVSLLFSFGVSHARAGRRCRRQRGSAAPSNFAGALPRVQHVDARTGRAGGSATVGRSQAAPGVRNFVSRSAFSRLADGVKLSQSGGEPRRLGPMSAIPLHLQRRFEQRWASRFALKNVGTKATTSKSTGRCAVAAKTQEKIRQGESATIVNLTAPIAVAILHYDGSAAGCTPRAV
jgi:hypothetical protein